MIDRLLVLGFTALVVGAGCIPQKAGDRCDLDADDCPEVFVCQAVVDGEAVCHVRVGGTCDAATDVDQFCADGTDCADDPDGGEGDAICGGFGSACPQAACVDGLVCRADDDGPICTIP
jgi:hypothetical protein